MPKQQTPLRYVAKIQSSRFAKAKFDLKVSFDDMRRSGEIVALGDSQMFDFIDELRGVTDCDNKAKELKRQIKDIQCEDDSAVNRNRLRKMRRELTQLLYKEDYLMVVMQNTKDFKRMCEKPFKFNGYDMKFLLATTGGVKTSTMIFTKVDIYDKLVERLNNGRNMAKQFSPAKLEAYMALSCSSSIKVSEPKGVLVVDDCVTHFKEDAIHLMDSETLDPAMSFIKDYDIELKESDGYGLMTPELSERWGIELGDGGGITGCCLRNAFLKGMAFTFDFHRFAREIAHTDTVKDVWGNEYKVDDIELIVPVSMLKLWDSYDSWEHYHKCCNENHYGFRVTKVCPLELEEQRTTNYQNLNPYDWDDETVKLFIKPTIQNIHDVLCGDWAKTILYSRGVGMKAETLINMPNDWCKAVMADERMMEDPFVKQKLKNMLERRINDAKIGVIDVEGNYSILSGDPYSLCQNIFGLEVTGLLKAGECYHEHWANKGVMEVVAYRAPMSAPNNIRTLYVSATEEQRDWYRYMKTCTILNSWDSTCHALNGADKQLVRPYSNVWGNFR